MANTTPIDKNQIDTEEETVFNSAVPESIQKEAQKIRGMMQRSAERFELRNRATPTIIILMFLVAIVFDILQILLNFIPFIGWILSFIIGIYAWFVFYIWTSYLGWNIGDTAIKQTSKFVVKSEKIMMFLRKYVLPIIEAIPIINILPGQTVGVFFSVLIIKSQDFIYNKTKGRVDENVIVEGIQFFNVLRDVYKV